MFSFYWCRHCMCHWCPLYHSQHTTRGSKNSESYWNYTVRFFLPGVWHLKATWHIVPRWRSPNPCLPQQQDTIPYAVKISVLRSWWWAKDCPKHAELILEINKLLLLHLVGFSVLLYLHWWCMVKHKSIFRQKLYRKSKHIFYVQNPFFSPKIVPLMR
jgi:hypothetical protein